MIVVTGYDQRDLLGLEEHEAIKMVIKYGRRKYSTAGNNYKWKFETSTALIEKIISQSRPIGLFMSG